MSCSRSETRPVGEVSKPSNADGSLRSRLPNGAILMKY